MVIVRRAQVVGAAGRLEDALAEYDAALAQWQGRPLEDISSVTLRRDVGAALDEERLAAVQARVDAMLALGRHEETLTELAGLTATYPLRERFWEQRMLALSRSGRPAEALTIYQRIVAILGEELGADPGPGLRELHQAVLRHEPTAQPPAPASAAATAAVQAPTGPRQLPPAVSAFTGRSAELALLDRILADSGAEGPGPIVIDGPGGVGKTALAVHWSHRVRGRFPDGQIYLNLHGYGPTAPVTAASALDTLLRALGMPTDRIPVPVEERAAALRSVTTDRRFLFLLDNARDAQQLRPLLPGPGCLTVITSRSQMRGLAIRDGAQRVPLGPIGAPEAAELLESAAGQAGSALTPPEVERLVGRCGGLPLALRIVAERLARDRRSLADVLRDLDDAGSRLDLLSSADDELSDMRTVLSWSTGALDPQAARALRLVGAQPGPDITVPAAALFGLPHARSAALLDRLVAEHLLEANPGGRFQPHDLLRAFAVELSARHPEDECAVLRLLDWHLAAAAKASQTIYPRESARKIPVPQSDAPLPDFAGAREAFAWFDAARPALIASIDAAVGFGLDDTAWMLAWSMWDYLDHRDRYDDYVATHIKGLQAARRAKSARGERHMSLGLTYAYVRLRDADAAMAHALDALGATRRLDEPGSEAAVHAVLAEVRTLHGDHEGAIRELEQALEIYVRERDAGGEMAMLTNLALVYIRLDRPREAIARLRRSLALIAQTGQDRGLGVVLSSLGEAHAKSGRHQAALDYYRRAHAVNEERGLLGRQAIVLYLMAESFEALDDETSAREHLTRSRELFRCAGDLVPDRAAALFATLDES